MISLIVGAGLVLAGSKDWLRPAQNLLAGVVKPIGSSFTQAGSGVGGVFDLLGSVKQLSDENAQLRARLGVLEQEAAKLREAGHQNEILRRQLGFREQTGYQSLPAEVIAYQPDNFRQYLTIARGTASGVKPGMAVIAEGFLVGKVSEASANFAKVFLLTDPEFKINAISQEGRATGTVSGQLGSGLVMEKIPQDEPVKPGETIITSGLGGELPKGIVIGRIESVDQASNAIFQTARIGTGLRLSKLELVFVVVAS
jgi:rod shape-determining protein MreC